MSRISAQPQPTNSIQEYQYSLDEKQLAAQLRKDFAANLVNKLKKCRAGNKKKFGNEDWRSYQDICFELLETTLENDFSPLNIKCQLRTLKIDGEKQEIKDIVLLNNPKNITNSCVWGLLRRDYGAKQIVFECKNYSDLSPISSEDVYQLFEYLDRGGEDGEVGRYGILFCRDISRLGKNGRSALRRLAKEHYHIAIIGDKEVFDWLNVYVDTGSSESYFTDLYNSECGKY